MQAILSDIHGNLEALEAVLEDIEKKNIKELVSLGDTVGYGPDPAACLKMVMQRFAWSLLGNHEFVLLNNLRGVFNPVAEQAIEWTRKQITEEEQLNYLRGLKPSRKSGKCLYVHGSAENPVMEYISEADSHESFMEFVKKIERDLAGFEVCFVGHNHRAFLGTPIAFLYPHEKVHEFHVSGQQAYVSVGSVGQPRDEDPRACYVTFDGDRVEYHRVKYDIQKTAQKIKKSGLHIVLARRLFLGL